MQPEDFSRERRAQAHLWTCLIGSVLLPLGCVCVPLESQHWIEARSARFRLVSQGDAESTREMLRDLEVFQAVVEQVTGARDSVPQVPTTARPRHIRPGTRRDSRS